jgi:hypothetical protein
METVTYLTKQTVEILAAPEGSRTHDQLCSIWNDLGFTIAQKLYMAAKYSDTSHEGHSLQEALKFWKYVKDLAKTYESRYTELRIFLKVEARTNPNRVNTCRMLLKRYRDSEKSLKGTADRMWYVLQDELILKKRKLSDLIQYREQRLEAKLKGLGMGTLSVIEALPWTDPNQSSGADT